MSEAENQEMPVPFEDGPLPIPIFVGAGFQIAATPTGSLLTITNLAPFTINGQFGAGSTPVCSVFLSHHAVRELSVLMGKTADKLEAEQGTITTPWLSEQSTD